LPDTTALERQITSQPDQLEAVLDRFLVYGNTTTSIVVSTPVPRRPPPLPPATAAG